MAPSCRSGSFEFRPRQPSGNRSEPSEPYTLTGVEFTRRWSLHILPKGFVKSRCFGGYSCRNRERYLRRCRALLGAEPTAPEPVATAGEPPFKERPPTLACPRCQAEMECVVDVARPGWNVVLNGGDRPGWYDPVGKHEPPDG